MPALGEGPLPDERLEGLYRAHAGQVLGPLIRMLRDFDAAEDALQEAIVVALERWPRDGEPDNPVAWLLTVARRRALDRARREARRGPKEEAATRREVRDAPRPPPDPADDRGSARHGRHR